MAVFELGALAGLTSELIGVGITGWKAHQTGSLGSEEAKVLQEVLGAWPGFRGVLKRDDRIGGVLQNYCELVTVAFGEAWRRHWVYDERLAPKQVKSRWTDWFRGEVQGLSR